MIKGCFRWVSGKPNLKELLNMWYQTKIIYGSIDNNKSFSLNGFTFYRTPTGKPKKSDSNGKRLSITEEEFQTNQTEYNYIFEKNVQL